MEKKLQYFLDDVLEYLDAEILKSEFENSRQIMRLQTLKEVRGRIGAKIGDFEHKIKINKENTNDAEKSESGRDKTPIQTDQRTWPG
jgi:hypothetical protein